MFGGGGESVGRTLGKLEKTNREIESGDDEEQVRDERVVEGNRDARGIDEEVRGNPGSGFERDERERVGRRQGVSIGGGDGEEVTAVVAPSGEDRGDWSVSE